MAEAAHNNTDTNADAGTAGDTQESAEDRRRDLSYMKRIGGWHASAVVAALVLFGAGHTWAAADGWLLAEAASVAAAFIAATVISSIGHEWGHFSGARLSGAVSPVAKMPRRLYFMFTFDMEANSNRQFLWMSWGGILGNWVLVLLALILVPLDSWASAMLVAALFGRAVNVSVFEVPITQQVLAGTSPANALKARLESPGIQQMPGLIAGLVALAALG